MHSRSNGAVQLALFLSAIECGMRALVPFAALTTRYSPLTKRLFGGEGEEGRRRSLYVSVSILSVGKLAMCSCRETR